MNLEDKDLKLAFADTVELIPRQEDKNVAVKRVAPDEFVVIKFGKNKFTMDGEEDEFDFDDEDADKLIDEFNRRGKDLLVDMEHASQIQGKPAPAWGWVKKLEKCRDGLLAKMANWTDEAKDYLESGKYRYHSPVLYFDKDKKNHPNSIHSIGLTNHPAIHNLTPLVANDNDTKIDPDVMVDKFKGAIEKIKCNIDFNHDYLLLNDKRHLSMLQDSLVNNINKFKNYLDNEKSDNAEEILQSFSDKLFLSDVSDRANEINAQFSGEEAISMLNNLKAAEGISATEIQFIDALINERKEEAQEKMFNDNNKVSNSKEGVTMSKLMKQLKKCQAYADMDEEQALALEEEILAEEFPTGEEGMDAIAEEANGVGVVLKTIMDSLKELASILEVPMEDEEMDQVALFDSVIKAAKADKDALADIADVFEADYDVKNPSAFSDAVVTERLVTPSNEDIQNLAKKVALNDTQIKEANAKSLVERAIQSGTVCKAHEKAALKRAMNDSDGFEKLFLSDDSLKVVPVVVDQPEAVSGEEDEATKIALSDAQKEIGKKFGRTEEEMQKIYSK